MPYADPEKNKECIKKYHKDNPDSIKRIAKEKRRKLNDPQGWLLTHIRSKAKRDGKEFNLTKEDLLVPELCPILKVPLKFGTLYEKDFSPSVDRIDNSKGYIKGNVKVISNKANRYKSDMSKEIIKSLYDYVCEI